VGEIRPLGHRDGAIPPPEEALPPQDWPNDQAPTDGQPVDVGSTTGTSKGEDIPKPADSAR